MTNETNRKCIRVCKAWRHTLKAPGYKILWRTIVIPDGRRRFENPSLKVFRELLSYAHGDVRTIVIENPMYAGLDSKKMLTIMHHAKRLETLEIHYHDRIKEKINISAQKNVFLSLKRLLLYSTHSVDFHQIPLPYDLVQYAAETLTSLDIGGNPGNLIETSEPFTLPKMPSLKYFRWKLAGDNIVRVTLVSTTYLLLIVCQMMKMES